MCNEYHFERERERMEKYQQRIGRLLVLRTFYLSNYNKNLSFDFHFKCRFHTHLYARSHAIVVWMRACVRGSMRARMHSNVYVCYPSAIIANDSIVNNLFYLFDSTNSHLFLSHIHMKQHLSINPSINHLCMIFFVFL